MTSSRHARPIKMSCNDRGVESGAEQNWENCFFLLLLRFIYFDFVGYRLFFHIWRWGLSSSIRCFLRINPPAGFWSANETCLACNVQNSMSGFLITCNEPPSVLSRWWFQTLFIFIPIWGFMIQFDEHFFQTGWFNHQLVIYETRDS